MSAYIQYPANTRKRDNVRAVAVPVSSLLLSGIIILLGITIAVLGLITVG